MAEFTFKQGGGEEEAAKSYGDIEEQAKQGVKFIRVPGDYGGGTPDGYELFECKYGNETFRVMMPRETLFCIAAAGEGDAKHGLEELAKCYTDIKRVEKKMQADGKRDAQEIVWATSTKEKYSVYLTTFLTKYDAAADKVMFQKSRLEEMCLIDPKVDALVKEMAAAKLGMAPTELQAANDLSQYLEHKTTIETDEYIAEATHIRCDCGSHQEIRTTYRIKQVIKSEGVNTEPMKVGEALKKIMVMAKQDNPKWGEWHDKHGEAVVKHYANLKYIIPTNHEAQFDIIPPST